MKYKVKVSEWYLKNRPSPNAKLPVKLDSSGKKIKLIGEGDEVITGNIQGIENDPRFVIEKVKSVKIPKINENIKNKED